MHTRIQRIGYPWVAFFHELNRTFNSLKPFL
jgi:hypothetical protein